MACGSVIAARWVCLTGGRAPFQVVYGVALGSAGSNGVAHDLAAVLQHTMSGLDRTTVHDPVHRRQKLLCRYFGNRPAAQPRENVVFHPQHDPAGVQLHPCCRLFGVPLARDDFKAVRGTFLARCLCRLALFARVDAGRQQLAGSVALVACVFKAGIGVCPHGEPFLLAPKAVLEPPQLAPGWRDFQIQAAAVEQPLRLVGWLRGAEGGIRERHVGHPNCTKGMMPPVMPPHTLGLQRMPPDTIGHKKGRNLCCR